MRASSSRREGRRATAVVPRNSAAPSTGQSSRHHRPPRPRAFRWVASPADPTPSARNRSLEKPRRPLSPARQCKTFSRPPFPLSISLRCIVPVVPLSYTGRFFQRRGRRVLLLLLLCVQTLRVPHIIQPKTRLNVYRPVHMYMYT